MSKTDHQARIDQRERRTRQHDQLAKEKKKRQAAENLIEDLDYELRLHKSMLKRLVTGATIDDDWLKAVVDYVTDPTAIRSGFMEINGEAVPLVAVTPMTGAKRSTIQIRSVKITT